MLLLALFESVFGLFCS